MEVGYSGAQVMDMMDPDAAGEPLQESGQLVKGAPLDGRFREAPLLPPLPVHSFELMLHVKQPEADRPGDHHDGKLNHQVRLDADGDAHEDRDRQEGRVRPVYASALTLPDRLR